VSANIQKRTLATDKQAPGIMHGSSVTQLGVQSHKGDSNN